MSFSIKTSECMQGRTYCPEPAPPIQFTHIGHMKRPKDNICLNLRTPSLSTFAHTQVWPKIPWYPISMPNAALLSQWCARLWYSYTRMSSISILLHKTFLLPFGIPPPFLVQEGEGGSVKCRCPTSASEDDQFSWPHGWVGCACYSSSLTWKGRDLSKLSQ